MEHLQYPIGRFTYDGSSAPEATGRWIRDIASLPGKLSDLVNPWSESQLNTPYREGGWTVLQVIHHLADSHINAYVRLKLALTEDNPVIKPYDQDKWAELADYSVEMDDSMELLYGLHKRWSAVLHSLTSEQMERTYRHPESGDWTIRKYIAQYAWHGDHHLAHIRTLKERKNW